VIFGIILPFAALVVVGGLLALFLIKRSIKDVKGLWQTTGSKIPPRVSYEKPSVQEARVPHKPPTQNKEQSKEEEPLPANVNEGNQSLRWRW
jgi:hypothetical protein